MNKFTEEQIAAIRNRWTELHAEDALTCNSLIAELSRPAVEFEEGEVAHNALDYNDCYFKHSGCNGGNKEATRKLSTKEAGATKLVDAIETGIEAVSDHPYKSDKIIGCLAKLQTALDKWKSERGEE